MSKFQRKINRCVDCNTSINPQGKRCKKCNYLYRRGKKNISVSCEDAVRVYRQGNTMEETARILKCSDETIYSRLVEVDEPRRDSSYYKPNLGNKHIQEAKDKMSIAREGRVYSKETREKQSATLMGHPNFNTELKGCFKKGHTSPNKGKHPEYLQKENNPNYRHGKYFNNNTCNDCGVETAIGSTWCMECVKSYMNFCGEKASNWRGGLSFEVYPVGWNNRLKESVRERDNHICQVCFHLGDSTRKRLAVHHIDYDKNNWNQDNLISLCIKCHAVTHGNRDYWTTELQKKIAKRGISDVKISA